jgi:hypothetical protein
VSSSLFLPGRFYGSGKVFILRYFLMVFLSKPVCLAISLIIKPCEYKSRINSPPLSALFTILEFFSRIRIWRYLKWPNEEVFTGHDILRYLFFIIPPLFFFFCYDTFIFYISVFHFCRVCPSFPFPYNNLHFLKLLTCFFSQIHILFHHFQVNL